MPEDKKLTLRVQSSEGTARVVVSATECTARLYEAAREALGLASFAFALHRDRARREEIVSSKSRLLDDLGLKHGDMIYLSPVNGAVLYDQPSTSREDASISGENEAKAGPSKSSLPPFISSSNAQKELPQEDEVDLELYKMAGTIQRERDEKLCRHNSKGCCVHCSPLEPWDENYLKENNIKHLSFHSYIRKMASTPGKFVSLDELSLEIKPGCKEHPAWPRGICSKCQPGAVTLSRQAFRHVDNVLWATAAPVDRFLTHWRATGQQRVGLLLGSLEPHPGVPLGIRVRVEVIYEPPQSGSRDGVSLAVDPRRGAVDALAQRLGLRHVGWCFTDLLPDEQDPTKVQHIRGVDTHFLSAQECIMAAHFQNQHPNPCRHSRSGYFGSKFVTVCITGDRERQIHMEGYQVSAQCQALVRARALLPTRDAPELGYIRDSTPQHYVPDVYYKERDAYGNEVSVLARRVPVAYVLVDVPVGAAAGGAAGGGLLPPAHRPHPAQHQSLERLHQHIEQAPSFLEAMSDFHVLLYLLTNEVMPLSAPSVHELCGHVRARDAAGAAAWRARPDVRALLQLCAAVTAPAPMSSVSAEQVWTCQLCTFHNAGSRSACEMCAMPRNSTM